MTKSWSLRTEIRVFYDMDSRKLLYSANYWDYDYVRPHLYNRTDIILFDATRDEIQKGYAEHVGRAEALVSEHFKDVDLPGKWSIDIYIY